MGFSESLKLVWMEIPVGLKEAFSAAQRILCVSHPSADGDAVGSLGGIFHTLSAMGKAVTLVLPDAKPRYLRYVPGWEYIHSWSEEEEAIRWAAAEADLYFAVDFGRWDRLPEALQVLIPQNRLVWVDHHVDSEPLSTHWNFWFPEAAATTEILYVLLSRLSERPLPLPARIALYIGLLTDTGGFRFRSVTPRTFQIAANLIAPPFPLEAIHHQVFRNKSLFQMQLQSYLLQNQLYSLEGLPVRMLSIPMAVLERFSATWEDVRAFSNQLLALEGTLLSIVLKEYGPMETRLSIRGGGDFPCHELAAQFDKGGGHRNAAGATLYKPLTEAFAYTENLIRTQYADQIVREFERFTHQLSLHIYT